jgi:putative membrane protein
MTLFADTYWHDGPHWWFVFFPLVWIAVIVTAIWIIRRTGGLGGWRAHPVETGIDVLERRFAAGEIDADEYRRRRAVLDERRT